MPDTKLIPLNLVSFGPLLPTSYLIHQQLLLRMEKLFSTFCAVCDAKIYKLKENRTLCRPLVETSSILY